MIVIGLIVFFHLSHLDSINATNNNVILVTDQDFTTEKSIAAPVIAQRPSANQHTIFVKQAKPLSHVTHATATQQ